MHIPVEDVKTDVSLGLREVEHTSCYAVHMSETYLSCNLVSAPMEKEFRKDKYRESDSPFRASRADALTPHTFNSV